MAVIEGRRLGFNGLYLAVNLMEGQSAGMVNKAAASKYQLTCHIAEFVLNDMIPNAMLHSAHRLKKKKEIHEFARKSYNHILKAKNSL